MAQQTPEIHVGDYVRLRKNPQRPSRYDGLEWEVITNTDGVLFLRLVGGDDSQTCGASDTAVESVYRPQEVEACGTVEFEINDNLFHIPVFDQKPAGDALQFTSGDQSFWLGTPDRIPWADES